tara:strand:+ start:1014 stop:1262 length:249 start_codon:yes stop_codon:yes gene_type:complete
VLVDFANAESARTSAETRRSTGKNNSFTAVLKYRLSFSAEGRAKKFGGRDELLLLHRFGITLLKTKHNVLFLLINDRTVQGS